MQHRPRFLFLADAGPKVGLGHVVRSCVLAGAVQAHQATVAMATPDDPAARAVCAAFGLSWRPWNEDTTAEVTVVDSYRTEVVASVKARLVVEIRDGPDREVVGDVVIDGAPGADAHGYRGPHLISALLGPQYALVMDTAATSRPRDVGAVIALGGGASASLIEKVAAVAEPCADGPVVVVAGPYSRVPSLPRVTVERTLVPAEVAALFCRSRIGVVTGGQTMLQAAAAGLPCIAIIVADNQRYQVRALERTGALIAVIEQRIDPALARALGRALRDEVSLEAAGSRAREIVDGKGAVRAAAALLTLASDR